MVDRQPLSIQHVEVFLKADTRSFLLEVGCLWFQIFSFLFSSLNHLAVRLIACETVDGFTEQSVMLQILFQLLDLIFELLDHLLILFENSQHVFGKSIRLLWR